jgi:hypothetical protein
MAPIARGGHVRGVQWLLRNNPVVAILGPRQIGGADTYELSGGIRAVAMQRLLQDLSPLKP